MPLQSKVTNNVDHSAAPTTNLIVLPHIDYGRMHAVFVGNEPYTVATTQSLISRLCFWEEDAQRIDPDVRKAKVYLIW